MEQSILEVKDWYSIDNVCRKLSCDVSDIKWLIDEKRLTPYGELNNELLLAFKDLTGRGYYGGKAQVRYTGKVKLNSVNTNNFRKDRVIYSTSVSISDEQGLEVVTTDDIFDSWIYKSHLNKWKCIFEDESFINFEYCKFPEKRLSPRKQLEEFTKALQKYAACGGE
ncbi:MAG: hypothetical protein HWE07_00385 [Cytophagia bacterium]|nr:hypothetical protein [Cytophagia bacterium]